MTDQEFILRSEGSTFTLENKNGQGYTYHVRQVYQVKPDPANALWFVALLRGPNNTRDFRHLGTIKRNVYQHGDSGGHWRPGKCPPVRESAPSAKIFAAFWGVLTLTGSPLPGWQLHRSAHCARCGRLLTNPESIENGIGPVCARLA